MQEIINVLFAATDNHAIDAGEPDHTIGDLQSIFTAAWNLMPVSQKAAFLETEEVSDLVTAGCRGRYSVASLQVMFNEEVERMTAVIEKAGITISEDFMNPGYTWKHPRRSYTTVFSHEIDAIASAYEFWVPAGGVRVIVLSSSDGKDWYRAELAALPKATQDISAVQRPERIASITFATEGEVLAYRAGVDAASLGDDCMKVEVDQTVQYSNGIYSDLHVIANEDEANAYGLGRAEASRCDGLVLVQEGGLHFQQLCSWAESEMTKPGKAESTR